MATRDRREFIPQALACFSRQSYSDSELIIVDDGRSPVGDLCEGVPHVRYIRLYRPATTGTKLNIGIERARGKILQKLDDDDYYHPDFLRLAVSHLPQTSDATVVAWDCFLVLIAGDPVLRHSGHGWGAGGTFCFHRELWRRKAFRDITKNEDYWFLNDHCPLIKPVCAAEYYMLVRHGRNTWKLRSGECVESCFRSLPPYRKSLEMIVPPGDLPFYRALQVRNQLVSLD